MSFGQFFVELGRSYVRGHRGITGAAILSIILAFVFGFIVGSLLV